MAEGSPDSDISLGLSVWAQSTQQRLQLQENKKHKYKNVNNQIHKHKDRSQPLTVSSVSTHQTEVAQSKPTQ